MSERWLSVVGWEGYYEVSDRGRVRSVERVIQRSSAPQTVTARILRPAPSRSGHLVVSLWRDGRGKTRAIHVLVAAAFLGPRPDGLEVCHGDGDPTNNALSNLRYDTRSANIYDAVRHGTHHEVRKTHCKNGHEFTPENTARHHSGGRQCRACLRKAGAAWRAKKKGAAA